MLSGVRAQIALKIFGEDLDSIRGFAEEFRGKLADIPGIVDLQVEKQVRIPHLEVIVDYRRAALYGIQPAAVTEQLERLSNGTIVSRIIDGNKRFDVVLRLEDVTRSTKGLSDLLIETPAGWIPVSQIAEVRAKRTVPTRSCVKTASVASSFSPIPTAKRTWPGSLPTSEM